MVQSREHHKWPKKPKYSRFNTPQNLEGFRKATSLKNRESLLLEPFLQKIWSFFNLDASTSDIEQVPNVIELI